MTAPTGGASGYLLETLSFPVQVLTIGSPDDAHQDSTWGWDWRWRDHDHFEVAFLLTSPPLGTRPELLQVSANALFRVVGDAQSVPVASFAHGHAPALMFPYIRQVVDELTSRSPYGRVLLPPMNVMALMQSFNANEATGAKSLRPPAPEQ